MKLSFKPTFIISATIIGALLITWMILSTTAAAKILTIGQQPCNCVIFRYDDIQDGWNNKLQNETLQVFIDRNAKAELGLIMNHYGNDSLVVNKVKQGHDLGLFELAVHGWDHVDYGLLSKEDQAKTIDQASQKFQQIFGFKNDIFIMPYNGYNEDTLELLASRNFTIISTAEHNPIDSPPFWPIQMEDSYGLAHIPATIDFPSKTVDVLLSEIDADIQTHGYAVVTVHPQDFRISVPEVQNNVMNQTQYQILVDLIDRLQDENIPIVTFHEMMNLHSQTKAASPIFP